MKKTVKLFSIILSLLIFASMLITPAAAYAAPTVAIQPNSATITTGGTVVITVRYTVSDTDIGAMLGHLEYDETIFEPVANSSSGDIKFGTNGAGGKITVQYDADGAGNKTISGSVTFKSKKVGSASFAVVTNELVNFSLEELGIPAKKTTTVNVQNVQLSSNNNLKSVSVSAGGTTGKATLTPAFSAAVTSYTVKVPHDTKNVSIDAVVADLGKATYTLDKTWAAPASGDWVRKLVVTAQNGDTKTYTFKIVKDAAPTPTPTPTPDPEPTPTPDPEPTPNEDLRVIVGENEYYVVTDFGGLETPSGFEQNITTYNNIEVPCYTSKDGTVTLLVLEDTEGNKDLFLYNRRYLEISAFKWNEVGAGKYIFANAAQYTNAVSELSSVDVKINGETVTAYKLGKNSEFVLVWAISTDGVGKLYVYDCTENTIQRYAEIHESAGSTNKGYNPEPLTKSVKLYIVVIIVTVMLAVILILIIAWLSALGKLRRIEGNRKEFDFVPFMEENNAITEFVAANESRSEEVKDEPQALAEPEADVKEEPKTEE